MSDNGDEEKNGNIHAKCLLTSVDTEQNNQHTHIKQQQFKDITSISKCRTNISQPPPVSNATNGILLVTRSFSGVSVPPEPRRNLCYRRGIKKVATSG